MKAYRGVVGRILRFLAARPGTWRAGLHTVFSLVVTWPLVGSLDSSLPNGTETPATVAYFNLWTMRWNQQQLGDLFRHYWDAPIFHPGPGAFALSEPQPLTGLVFTPISWVTGNPALAYNVVLLAAVTLNGVAAARLARRLGVAAVPALLVGLLAQVLPFVTNELGVLQLVMVFPMLFLAEAVLAWADEPGWGRGLALGAWLSATFLTCGYFGLFTLVVLGPAALVLARGEWLRPRRLAELAAAAALFAVLCGPILLGQQRYTSSYHRSDSLILVNSAAPGAYLSLYENLPGASFTPWLREPTGERLYPGTVPVVLGIAGLVLLVQPGPGRRRRVAAGAFLATGVVLALGLSMGLRLDLGGWHPYELVKAHVPGFADLRSPFRAAVLVHALLLPLAAVALGWLWAGAGPVAPAGGDGPLPGDPGPAGPAEPVGTVDLAKAGDAGDEAEAGAAGDEAEAGEVAAAVDLAKAGDAVEGARPPVPPPVDRTRTWAARAVAVALVLIGLIEVWPAPQQLAELPVVDASTDWVAFLAGRHDPGAGDGTVVMLPFPPNGNYTSYQPTTEWMLASLDHGHPLVNGYSGFFPPAYDELEGAMREGFPSDRTVQLLGEHHVSWVVLPRATFESAENRAVYATWSDVLRMEFTGEDMDVLSFTPPPSAPAG